MILKCLFPLAAISVVYVFSFPVTVKSPETATWSVIVQSFDSVNTPLVSAQFHSPPSATPDSDDGVFPDGDGDSAVGEGLSDNAQTLSVVVEPATLSVSDELHAVQLVQENWFVVVE